MPKAYSYIIYAFGELELFLSTEINLLITDEAMKFVYEELLNFSIMNEINQSGT